MKNCFSAADILLPNFDKVDGGRYSAVACDQFTSEPEYWHDAERVVGDSPSTLALILPEVYLKESAARVPIINDTMRRYLDGILEIHENCMIYLERTQSDGAIRRGLVGKIDLMCYDYTKGAQSAVRATEGTVAERIPPRVAVRRDAVLELPHVMVLIDDPEKTVIEPIAAICEELPTLYDFDLMLGGGHVRGKKLVGEPLVRIDQALTSLVTPEKMRERYGEEYPPLLFAVGDGNHSLASAKAAYEEIKAVIGEEAALEHPARYALVELVNLHDEALRFEPIYRVMFGVEPRVLLDELREYAASLCGKAEKQLVRCIGADTDETVVFDHPVGQLTVGTLQDFLDAYLSRHPEASVDYIHGEDSVRNLSARPDAVGFLFDGMQKNELFKAVICDGALPRKTFSMGHARDKRYYLEARRIK